MDRKDQGREQRRLALRAPHKGRSKTKYYSIHELIIKAKEESGSEVLSLGRLEKERSTERSCAQKGSRRRDKRAVLGRRCCHGGIEIVNDN